LETLSQGDTESVLEALAGALSIVATWGQGAIPAAARTRLVRVGRRALLEHPVEDEDDRWAYDLAAAGLAALEGVPLETLAGLPRDLAHPAIERIQHFMEGGLDGFAAGACAAHSLGCAE